MFSSGFFCWDDALKTHELFCVIHRSQCICMTNEDQALLLKLKKGVITPLVVHVCVFSIIIKDVL